jgi:hypothetical protein
MKLSIRMRGSERWWGKLPARGERDKRRGESTDGNEEAVEVVGRRKVAGRAARAYGGAAEIVRKEAEVVVSRSAAILTGDLDSVLRRAGQTIRQMAETLLEIDPSRTRGMVDRFHAAALEWVRNALMRYRSYSANHDRLPIGVSFENVRLILEPEHGGLSVDVGGVEFKSHFDFRTDGVVFDIRASETIREPAPGFYVDTGETGAATAHAIVETVRHELPSFGISEDTEGVCVLIRAEASDFAGGRSSAWVVDMDLHVPFDPGWSGGAS